jgi:predicted alpha/beta-fold hydrolase
MTGFAYPALPGFDPPFGLGHRHIQSMLGGSPLRRMIVRRHAADFVKRSGAKLLALDGGVRLLGLYTEHTQPKGLVVMLHGWEGCADSNYMLSVGASLYAAGYSVFRLNFRDHGDTQALNEQLFHSCRIEEVVAAVAAIESEYADRPISLIGFSLGGNFALRVARRAPRAGIELAKVLAVCPVLRPHHTMAALDGGFWVYRDYFLRRWCRSLEAKARAFPRIYKFGDLRRFRNLSDMTEFFVLNYTDFESLDAYLNGYSITGPALEGLAVRSTVIATNDDPVIPARDLDEVAGSANLTVHRLERGGHCGLVDTYMLSSWIDSAVLNLL